MIQPWHILFVLAGYLLGSIPFGLLMGLSRGVDVRRVGSGNTGATNVLRTLGWKAAAVVFLADLLKAVIPVMAARYLVGVPLVEVATGVAAVAGHNWSFFLRFRGGRGVSTFFGGLAALPFLLIFNSTWWTGLVVRRAAVYFKPVSRNGGSSRGRA